MEQIECGNGFQHFKAPHFIDLSALPWRLAPFAFLIFYKEKHICIKDAEKRLCLRGAGRPSARGLLGPLGPLCRWRCPLESVFHGSFSLTLVSLWPVSGERSYR